MSRLFDIDPWTGAVETFDFDEATGTAIIKRVEDVEPVIEANKRSLTSGHNGYTPSKDMRLAASIPIGVVYEWLTKHGVNLFDKNHEAGVRRLLNSNEYRYLRTSEFIL